MPHLIDTYPFWAHIICEAPASLNFFLYPSEQLSAPAPQAHALIKQYSVLLLVSSLIALIFALRPLDQTSRNVAAALSLYHLAPSVRALERILDLDGEEGQAYGQRFGGPWAHLLVHSGLCAAFVVLFLVGKTEKLKVKK